MSIKDDIDLLEHKLARLKVEYEQYFQKILKREPLKLRDEVEKIVLAYSNKNISNTSLKFRYNSLVARFNTYRQYWTRVARAIEEGTYYRQAEGSFFPSVGEAPRPGGNHANGARAEGAQRDPAIVELFKSYVEARKACNEPVEGLTYEAVARTIDQYKKKVEEQYKTTDVDLKVSVKDGKTRLVITPKVKD